MSKTEFSKGLSKWYLYVSIFIIIIGIYLTFYKENPIGYVITGIGFIICIYWLSNRKDQNCTFDEQDNMTCIDVVK